jgi:hypothetical protein
MSEFKFACPVCGQHITSDSSASGTHLDCPTCFQTLIVPQAPKSGESKFIIAAAQVSKARPTVHDLVSAPGPKPRKPPAISWPGLALVLILVGGGAAGIKWWRGRQAAQLAAQPNLEPAADSLQPATSLSPYPVPTNTSWTLTLTNALIPEGTAAGRINGDGFFCEKATLQGGNLSLWQGEEWPPDYGVTVRLAAREGQDLSGKTVVVGAERPPPIPRVTLRWKNEQRKAVAEDILSGYALRIVFGPATNQHISGQIYVALPDSAQSFVAGKFDAEIRKARPPMRPPPPRASPAPSPAPAPTPPVNPGT